jgi:integrase/recombinase XerD
MRSLGHEKIETTMIYPEKVFKREKHAIHAWSEDVFGEYI